MQFTVELLCNQGSENYLTVSASSIIVKKNEEFNQDVSHSKLSLGLLNGEEHVKYYATVTCLHG